MKRILVCNQKGGVGKSLIADELAYSFEKSAISVAFMDLDQQGGTNHVTDKNDSATIMIADTPGAFHSQLSNWMQDSDIIIVPTRPTFRDIPPLQHMVEIISISAPKKM